MDDSKNFRKIDEYIHKFGSANSFVQKIINSLDCSFVIINAASLEIEITNDEKNLNGIKCFDFLSCLDCDPEGVKCIIKRVVDGKKAIVIKNEDFFDVLLEIHAHPIFNSNGEVVSVILYKFDVSKFLIDFKKRFQDFFEINPRGMLRYELKEDREFSLTSINTSAEKMLNINSKKILGKNIKQTFPGIKDIKFFNKCYEIAFSGGSFLSLNIPSNYNNVERFYEFVLFQISNKALIISFIDITKIKEIKKTANKKICLKDRVVEQKYKILFEQAPDSIIISDPESGKFLDFNENAYKNLGYTKNEFSNLKISDIDAIESSIEVKRHVEKIKKEGFDFFETKHREKNGEILDVMVSAKYFNVNEKSYQQSIWKDITEIKRLEKELKHSEERFYNILQNSHDLVYRYNFVKESFDYVSESVFTILGYSLGEFIKMKMCDYNKRIHPNDQEMVHCGKNSEKESVSNIQYRFKRKDGVYIWLDVKRVFFSDDFGKITHSIEDIKDITSQKLIERENLELEERLSEMRNKTSCEKGKISLTDKEKLVLWGFCRNPLLNDEELANTLGLKRSTLTAIKNRLKEKNWFNFIYIPNFHKLDCQFFSIIDMKFKGNGKDILSLMKESPDIILSNYQDNEIFGVFVSDKYVNFKKFVRNIFGLDNSYYDFNENSFFYELDNFELYNFSGLVNFIFELKRDKKVSIHKFENNSEKLNINEKRVLHAMVKNPEISSSEIAKKIWISKPTVIKLRKKLLEENYLYPYIIPNF